MPNRLLAPPRSLPTSTLADEFYERVSAATPGTRNETLRDAAWFLALDHQLTDETLNHLLLAAQQAGLDKTSAQATLNSAKHGALRAWRPYARALDDLELRLSTSVTPVIRESLLNSAYVCCYIQLRTKGQPFGLSVRTLAERCGITKSVASRHLGLLRHHQFLLHVEAAAEGVAARYRVRRPYLPAQKQDSLENIEDEELSRKCAQRHLRVQIASSNPLRRFGGGLTLPGSAGRILAELHQRRAMSKKELQTALQCHRNTLRPNLAILESAGLVETRGSVVYALTDHPLEGLEEWAETMDIPDRAALMREYHQAERVDRKELYERMGWLPRRGGNHRTGQPPV